jgi:hypothetical protein
VAEGPVPFLWFTSYQQNYVFSTEYKRLKLGMFSTIKCSDPQTDSIYNYFTEWRTAYHKKPAFLTQNYIHLLCRAFVSAEENITSKDLDSLFTVLKKQYKEKENEFTTLFSAPSVWAADIGDLFLPLWFNIWPNFDREKYGSDSDDPVDEKRVEKNLKGLWYILNKHLGDSFKVFLKKVDPRNLIYTFLTRANGYEQFYRIKSYDTKERFNAYALYHPHTYLEFLQKKFPPPAVHRFDENSTFYLWRVRLEQFKQQAIGGLSHLTKRIPNSYDFKRINGDLGECANLWEPGDDYDLLKEQAWSLNRIEESRLGEGSWKMFEKARECTFTDVIFK